MASTNRTHLPKPTIDEYRNHTLRRLEDMVYSDVGPFEMLAEAVDRLITRNTDHMHRGLALELDTMARWLRSHVNTHAFGSMSVDTAPCDRVCAQVEPLVLSIEDLSWKVVIGQKLSEVRIQLARSRVTICAD